jgi:azurin
MFGIFFILYSFSNQAFAGNCTQTVASNDNLGFDKKELKFSKSCKQIEIRIRHTGKLPATAMGHGIIVFENKNYKRLVNVSNLHKARKKDKHYVPDSKYVLSHSKIVGGGKKEVATLDVSELNLESVDLGFYCSFPGHASISKGNIQFY